MNEELKQYCDRLQEELKAAETSLARVGQHLVSPELTPLTDWKALLQTATTDYRAKREQAQQAAQRVKVWFDKMENRAATPLDESDLGGEAVKAENMAQNEEALALDAVRVAAHALLQAEVAVLSAFKTRKTAFDLERFRNTF
jgi:hypothetical protein